MFNKIFKKASTADAEQLGEQLFEAVRINSSSEKWSKLIKDGANVNWKDSFGRTPLTEAARTYNLTALNMLIAAKADLNAQDGNGYTGLIIASTLGYPEVVEILLTAGADIDIESNNKNKTAIDLARERGHTTIAERLQTRSEEVRRKKVVEEHAKPTAEDMEKMRNIFKTHLPRKPKDPGAG